MGIKKTVTKVRESANTAHRSQPKKSLLRLFGTFQGRESSTIAVRQAQSHQPLPKRRGRKIFEAAQWIAAASKAPEKRSYQKPSICMFSPQKIPG